MKKFVFLLLCMCTFLIMYAWHFGEWNWKLIPLRREPPACTAPNKTTNPVGDTWQLALPPSILYVYSAFYDRRDTNRSVIHVIGAVNGMQLPSLLCHLWTHPNSSNVTTVQGDLWLIPEGGRARYTAVYVECPLPANMTAPYAVSITDDNCQSSENMIVVTTIPTAPVTSSTFAHCVSPLHDAYDNVDQLVETVEINRMFGVSHVFIYNFSSSILTRRVVDRYVADGYATVIQWNVPMWSQAGGIEPFGELAQHNDCLMRTAGHYKYTVFSDLDELLVPRRDNNWHELFNRLQKQPGYTAWTFRSSIFKTDLPSDPEMTRSWSTTLLNATSLFKVHRGEMIYATGIRSRMILDALSVTMVGVHNVLSFHKHGRMAVLEEKDGLCHQYQDGDDSKPVLDRNLSRFKGQILAFVGKGKEKKLKGIADRPPPKYLQTI